VSYLLRANQAHRAVGRVRAYRACSVPASRPAGAGCEWTCVERESHGEGRPSASLRMASQPVLLVRPVEVHSVVSCRLISSQIADCAVVYRVLNLGALSKKLVKVVDGVSVASTEALLDRALARVEWPGR